MKEYEGAYQAVSYLINNGHQNIGMLKESTGYYQLEERFNGYRHALKDHQIPFKGRYVESAELTVTGGYDACKKLLKYRELTAIFVGMMLWRSAVIKQSMKQEKSARGYFCDWF